MTNKILPHLIGPAVTFGLTVLLQIVSQHEWYTPSLALAFIGLAFSAVYGGLRSGLLSATIIVSYGIVEFNYDPARIIQTAIGAYSIAIVNGVGRRLLKQWILEAEYYHQKAVDTFNGNRAKMVQALDQLDKALEARNEVDIKKSVQVARVRLADTLTLVTSWHEMAQDKKIAIEEIQRTGGYPWRADDKIREIDILTREILRELHQMRRVLEDKEVL